MPHFNKFLGIRNTFEAALNEDSVYLDKLSDIEILSWEKYVTKKLSRSFNVKYLPKGPSIFKKNNFIPKYLFYTFID